jgi:hypothetical protein
MLHTIRVIVEYIIAYLACTFVFFRVWCLRCPATLFNDGWNIQGWDGDDSEWWTLRDAALGSLAWPIVTPGWFVKKLCDHALAWMVVAG